MSSAQTKTQQLSRRAGVWLLLDKLGTAGAIISAVGSPCCFPVFAAVGSLLGLGSVPLLRGKAPILIPTMTALAFVGQMAAYRKHRRRGPLVTSAASVGLVVVAYSLSYHVLLVYAALAGLAIAASWNWAISRRAHHCCSLASVDTPPA